MVTAFGRGCFIISKAVFSFRNIVIACIQFGPLCFYVLALHLSVLFRIILCLILLKLAVFLCFPCLSPHVEYT
ncbi:MAG: hypothetical protein [Inoviridae sp.]|nr:MAG: hypothetical protein [Inoviridae sp.]